LENLLLFRAYLDNVDVLADFEGVAAARQCSVVGKLKAALDAVDGGVRFAAEISVTGDIYADVAAARKIGIAEMNASPGDLQAELVEDAVTQDSVVLEGDVEIAGLIDAGARARVLAEDLVLRGGLNPGDQRRRNADAEERSIVIAPALIEARGPQTGFFSSREIAADGSQRNIGCRKGCGESSDRGIVRPNSRSSSTEVSIDRLSQRARHRYGELPQARLLGNRIIRQECRYDPQILAIDSHIGSRRQYGFIQLARRSQGRRSWTRKKLLLRRGKAGCRINPERHALRSAANAGKSGFFTLRVFIAEEIKRLVFLQRAAEGQPRLRARVGLLDGHKVALGVNFAGESVSRLEIFAAALGDDVHHAARGAAILRIVVAENHLEFLYRFLRDSRTNAVGGVVSGVGAIDANHVGTRASTTEVQAAVGCGANGGRDVPRGLGVREREIDIVAAVDGQVINLAFLDGLCAFRAGGLNRKGFRAHGHHLGLRTQLQLHVQGGFLADPDLDRRILVRCEICTAFHVEFVFPRHQTHDDITPPLSSLAVGFPPVAQTVAVV